jgi:hypothetical protein
VNRFVENAVGILNAAENALQSGHSASDMTILINADGGIRMLADSDWPLESLQTHHGSRMVYRVRQQGKSVRIEGRAGSRTCMFETAKPDWAARHLLGFTPPWQAAPSRQLLSS